ncbi:type III pantothenate kinase [Cecembia lonarensis]|uniref:Type III pantothenate kinase n=1 Tax=Cecembia lonarensis (strain CCUG 58316 / KCTC 22772 / LW9) TaxID=1225176 RepID=K1L649_CECL9|nr:type III pantothenate kinase [Cecembia lonarensis]EKB47562.1 Type III pantothenate kinase [Cecembia lonarensis LW9]
MSNFAIVKFSSSFIDPLKQFVVDIGNTRIKTAQFEEHRMVDEVYFEDFDAFRAYSGTIAFDHALISSVTYTSEVLRDLLDFPFLFLSKSTLIPIKNLYATPETLGVDRKAAAVGARCIFEQGPLLTIDMGSCITYEILDEEDQYFGGAISPGLKMRFRAMHQQTARLPLLDLPLGEKPELIGNSTEKGMKSGVYYGIQHEMLGFIAAYQAKYPNLRVIICGGDSKIFESLTKDHIFVIPNLVLYGLNRILTYNVHLQ